MSRIEPDDLLDAMTINEVEDLISWTRRGASGWARDQAREIRQHFPGALIEAPADWSVRASLELAPHGHPYRVELFAHRTLALPGGTLVRQPHGPCVRVPDLPLSPWPPHIYLDQRPPGFKLCLYYPWSGGKKRVWREDDPLIELLYLADQWLAGYEIWQITGKWPFPEYPHSAPVAAPDPPPERDSQGAPGPVPVRLTGETVKDQGTGASRFLVGAAGLDNGIAWPNWRRQARAVSTGTVLPPIGVGATA